MTKKWISDGRQRASKTYGRLHAQLVSEVFPLILPEPDKQERKRIKHLLFRQQAI